jgi:hypothetical protein
VRAFRYPDQDSPRALWLWLRHEERYYAHTRKRLQLDISRGYPGDGIAATASLMLATAALADSIRARLWPARLPAYYFPSSVRRRNWAALTECAVPVR